MTDELTPRERTRLDTIEQIKQIARRHLATEGQSLSLRAVARELGVVSSGVYRYFAGRDELLAALITDSHEALAAAVTQAESAVPRRDVEKRWLAVGRAVRTWSVERPHEFSLLFGNPAPGGGTAHPSGAPALAVALQVLLDGVERGVLAAPADRLPKAVRTDAELISAAHGAPALPAAVAARAVGAWAQLIGVVGSEVFGTGGASDTEAWFEHQLKLTSRLVGLS